ncbi:hypothetical protein TNCV_5077341 [Trichonephila clavipes]|uniref:Uncharacterized protein n=1 Tax=Trichonephila clavipes TaxID=2585209 RepID=A0A8X6V1P2_TRICX|nr:hypothetical protein TNCV_5077341 [Trichonephila clavipes]
MFCDAVLCDNTKPIRYFPVEEITFLSIQLKAKITSIILKGDKILENLSRYIDCLLISNLIEKEKKLESLKDSENFSACPIPIENFIINTRTYFIYKEGAVACPICCVSKLQTPSETESPLFATYCFSKHPEQLFQSSVGEGHALLGNPNHPLYAGVGVGKNEAYRNSAARPMRSDSSLPKSNVIAMSHEENGRDSKDWSVFSERLSPSSISGADSSIDHLSLKKDWNWERHYSILVFRNTQEVHLNSLSEYFSFLRVWLGGVYPGNSE